MKKTIKAEENPQEDRYEDIDMDEIIKEDNEFPEKIDVKERIGFAKEIFEE